MVLASALLFLGFFLTMTRMHERYPFPLLALLALLLPLRRIWPAYGLLTLAYTFNLVYALDHLNRNEFIPDDDRTLWVVPLLNLAVYLYLYGEYRRMLRGTAGGAMPPAGAQKA
ncbi:MAG: hypothetical protein HY558_07095 [Euryarchaeota archaeon]|nr:hypothetical protein [Euryarchaeota archaeon]